MPRRQFNAINSDIEDEGSYLASMSDMMSGLLFIFIITLIVFVINFNMKRIEAVEQQQDLEEKYDELTDARKTRAELLSSLERSLKSQGVEVSIDEDHGLLHIPEDILFASGSAALPPQGGASLNILADQLAKLLPCYSGARDALAPAECHESFRPGRLEAVFIEGHTDNVPMPPRGGIQDNWDLSTKRAVATFKHLINRAPQLNAFTNQEGSPLFGVSGYGESRPRNFHATPTADPQNRRIDLRFLLAAPRAEGEN
jgi:flagellar motor protein MotB